MAVHNIGFSATFQRMSTPSAPDSEPEHPEQRREGQSYEDQSPPEDETPPEDQSPPEAQ